VMLNGFGTVVNALGKRVKPYLPQICGTILWRLNNKSAKVRQQAADLISRIAIVMKTCQEVCLFFVFWRRLRKFSITLCTFQHHHCPSALFFHSQLRCNTFVNTPFTTSDSVARLFLLVLWYGIGLK
jgi:hypothetical protein